mmetsp:Transcript_74292/g.206363  ORF Transcript_74292/g.206363 Transcript_74292/m.206363 type:complete len:202 (+) Transcript_74292:76-681(+)
MAVELKQPPKPQNSYWLWLTDNRGRLTRELGNGKVAEVGKLAGQKWKALSAREKKPYEEKAARLRAAHGKAMTKFLAQGGKVVKRNTLEERAAKAKLQAKKAKRAALIASGRPLKPQNPYCIWIKENRDILSREAGSSTLVGICKVAGNKWRALTEAEKRPFEAKAARLKARYARDMEKWRNGGGQGEKNGKDDGNDDEDL